MGYIVRYDQGTEQEKDAAAIADIKSFVDESVFNSLVDMASQCKTAIDCAHMNVYFSFIGIEGRPFPAFMRRYALESFKAWMHGNNGEKPCPVDEHGYPIKE